MNNIAYQFVSLLLQVPVLAAALILILIWFGIVPSQELSWIGISLLFLSLLPMLYGSFVYKKKLISNADITERRERLVPFFVITVVYGIYLLATIFFDSPVLFKIIAIHYFVLAFLLSATTVVWKVSVHTAGVTQFVALLTILIGSQALILLPLIIFTGWLRITMRSHSFWQVLGGVIVALLSILIGVNIRFS